MISLITSSTMDPWYYDHKIHEYEFCTHIRKTSNQNIISTKYSINSNCTILECDSWGNALVFCWHMHTKRKQYRGKIDGNY
jgi:hypothetical protein